MLLLPPFNRRLVRLSNGRFGHGWTFIASLVLFTFLVAGVGRNKQVTSEASNSIRQSSPNDSIVKFEGEREFLLAHPHVSVDGYRDWIANARDSGTQTRYVLGTVEKKTIIATVTGSGQVSSENRVDIHPKISGDCESSGTTPSLVERCSARACRRAAMSSGERSPMAAASGGWRRASLLWPPPDPSCRRR